MPGELIVTVLMAAFCGYVFSEQLTRPGMVFNWLYLQAEERFPWWLHKPLITCFKCVAGQWALWAYVISSTSFHLGWAFASSCAGVALSIILHKLLDHD